MEYLEIQKNTDFILYELAKIGLCEGDGSLHGIIYHKIATKKELRQLKRLWKLCELCASKDLYDPSRGWDNIKVHNGTLILGYRLYDLLTRQGRYPKPHFQSTIRMIHNTYEKR